tara:strand:- start:2230 stop:2547 length:318 start_codon:yes stop_codon:yes gene_type:complete
MSYFKKYFFLLSILIFLNSCGGWSNFKKAISGEKVVTTDEFLIKKKDPLVLPPEYEKLPLPNSKNKKANRSSVESALGSSKKTSSSSKATSNLENIILKELRKNK